MFGGQYSYLAMGISSRGTCSAWICYYLVRKFAVVMDGSERSDDLWSIMRETSLWGNKPCHTIPGTDMKLLLYVIGHFYSSIFWLLVMFMSVINFRYCNSIGNIDLYSY